MNADPSSEALNRHYGRDDLAEAIFAALRASGKNPDALTPGDLAPVDQFHTRGTPATLELATLAGLGAGMQVLDVGGGIGGPARTLAAELDCRVTVLDLTEAYVRAGEELTRRLHLSHRVSFRHGSALALPFPNGSFDAVWTQHSSMNIADKARLYAGFHEVLRPGGVFALHEVMAGPAGAPRYPLPWAGDPSLSFLRPPQEVRALISAAGFAERVWQDVTAPSNAFFQQVNARLGSGTPPPLGIHLLMGEDSATGLANMARSLAEGRITLIEAVFSRAEGVGKPNCSCCPPYTLNPRP